MYSKGQTRRHLNFAIEWMKFHSPLIFGMSKTPFVISLSTIYFIEKGIKFAVCRCLETILNRDIAVEMFFIALLVDDFHCKIMLNFFIYIFSPFLTVVYRHCNFIITKAIDVILRNLNMSTKQYGNYPGCLD